jgi:hypothetical protein
VLGAEIMLPEGGPAWMADRSALWNAVEAIEKRGILTRYRGKV